MEKAYSRNKGLLMHDYIGVIRNRQTHEMGEWANGSYEYVSEAMNNYAKGLWLSKHEDMLILKLEAVIVPTALPARDKAGETNVTVSNGDVVWNRYAFVEGR